VIPDWDFDRRRFRFVVCGPHQREKLSHAGQKSEFASLRRFRLRFGLLPLADHHRQTNHGRSSRSEDVREHQVGDGRARHCRQQQVRHDLPDGAETAEEPRKSKHGRPPDRHNS
jgi:hypothetical protein